MRVRLRALPIAAILIGAAGQAQGIAEERRALADATRAARDATVRAQGFDRAAAAADGNALRARHAQAAIAARIQAAEAGIAAAQARIDLIERLRTQASARLATLQAPIVRMGAALQTLARRPPALALVQPGSIDDLVHVRVLLAAGVPVIRDRSARVRAVLDRARRLRMEAGRAVRALRDGHDRLGAERTALARAEAESRARSARLVDSAMLEQDRALAMGERARDIVTLMDDLDMQAARRDRLASLPGPIPRPLVPGLAHVPAPAVAGSARLPPYRMPVVGRVRTGLGEVSPAGIRARGLTLATAAGAQVVSPAAGRIAYAAPFRGYGRIVIVDHGGGWTTLLTGLGRVSVVAGDAVEQGSPIGVAAARDPGITVELRRAGRPVDITPLVARG